MVFSDWDLHRSNRYGADIYTNISRSGNPIGHHMRFTSMSVFKIIIHVVGGYILFRIGSVQRIREQLQGIICRARSLS